MPSSILGLAALLWGFAQAPFSHFHTGDHDPASNPIHIHFRASTESGPQLAASDDDDEVDLDWSAFASHSHRLHLDLEAVDRIGLDTSTIAQRVTAAVGLHSHDPPALVPPNLRGPPA